MLQFTLTNIAAYRHQEQSTAVFNCPMISLQVSGIEFHQVTMPGGAELRLPKRACPSFLVGMPGTEVRFTATKGRENWVIAFESDDMRYSELMGALEIRDQGGWVPLPAISTLAAERVAGWQVELQLMREMLLEPLPRNLLRARLGFVNILRNIVDRQAGGLARSPAAKLKRLIDEDVRFERRLSELGRKCRYSRDHLRVLFQKEYGITPSAYRNQVRMAKVMELIANSELSVKEIAYQTGFAHAPHLCGVFRRELGISPGEGIRRFRDSERRVPGRP